ncbi:hypothetical protein M427DRAFT_250796 [Gonapodya prolifera JEL478]|uniref:L domain-like protein n=1 Tax=Gonapodya prolifera (strain JEL478) TaxID=1344416 RepID=A0A138ZXE8_GONPJ|nr:hypothetical protein M427DRAFT_250796 [Gonapodya prolifera JEL478]|eukprot:KXS09134.1 hypothetical protein M427DRAFT_250796 [Gonapodya prolifera JEL478]
MQPRFPLHTLKNIRYADCANGRIIGLDLTYFGLTATPELVINTIYSAFPDLCSLDLSKNSLAAGPVPSIICEFSKLEFLSLRNFTTGQTSLPDCFGNLRNLEFLYIMRNSGLTGFIPQSMTTLDSVRQLHLDWNDFSGDIPDFSKLPNLGLFSALRNPKLTGKLASGGFKALDNPLLNRDGTSRNSCDLFGTSVCLPAGYTGPECELMPCSTLVVG